MQGAKKALIAAQQRSDKLQQNFDRNEKKIASLKAKLNERSGSLLELFGVVRQVAGDTEAILEESLVSTQIHARKKVIGPLAKSDKLPSIERFESLWITLLQEMTESGKVVTYLAPVVGADGSEREQQVTRVGIFNAVSGSSFLRHLPASGKLQVLPRQPAGRVVR